MKNELWISENQLKNDVYASFDKERYDIQKKVARKKKEIEDGGFEDQSAFMLHGELGRLIDEQKEKETVISHLYSKPYFAHIKMLHNGSEEEDYLLSDCDKLETYRQIGPLQYLVPFKQDTNRPFLSTLFHCYQARDGKEIHDKTGDISKPVLICDDEILNGELLEAILLYSAEGKLSLEAVDELLSLKLQENRNNPALRNIIATLQRSQFDIIQENLDSDFVVQGCAGSGKSQILLHRLFYLRDTLSSDNWSHVLLITPSALFRNYSADLVRRYGLSNIKNRSVTELYKTLLEAYDNNFKNRQYVFKLTEEYLPDEYLHDIYSEETIERLDREIDYAIKKHISNACDLVNAEKTVAVNATRIQSLLTQIQMKIDMLSAESKSDYSSLEESTLSEQLDGIRQLIDECEHQYDQNQNLLRAKKKQKATFESLLSAEEEAKEERSTWNLQRLNRISLIEQELEAIETTDRNSMDAGLPARYVRQLSLAKDIEAGETYQRDEEYAGFLDLYCEDAKNELLKFTENISAVKFSRMLDQDIASLEQDVQISQENLSELTTTADRIASKMLEISKGKSRTAEERKAFKSQLQSTRYYLQRLESAVFESEVWNALAPLKKKYNIKTVEVEETDSGNRRSRILYKSDLLFYLKIYERIHSTKGLPQFSLLCIDEGQDLHKADYDLLRRMFPNACFNVFGDVAQELHEDCGVHNWKEDTGSDKIYELNKNYRNAAAIADFCNTKFGSTMECLGFIHEENIPEVIEEENKLRDAAQRKGTVIIVKNREEYNDFCKTIGCDESAFEFIDTSASETKTTKTKCYTIYSAKGLEFSQVLVFAKGMTNNQKLVACTRAMEKLVYYE